MKMRIILVVIIVINLFLNVYGNNWGLPSRWYVDEKVANVLHMLSDRTTIDAYDFYYHPTGYQIFLAVCLLPFLAYLKISGYPIEALKGAAALSWMDMAKSFPDFAINIYVYSRTISAILGALVVYLIFLLGKKVYDEKAGLLSAAFLSVTMGFVGANHFAKYTTLEIFFVVFTLLLCIKNSIFWAALLAGISLSIQLDAFILLLPLAMALFSNTKNVKRFILSGIGMMLLYVAGFIIATPSFVIHPSDYILTFKGLFLSNSAVPGKEKLPLFIGPLNYFFELLSIYGIFIFGLVLYGVYVTVRNYKKVAKGEVVIFVFILAYLLMMTVFSDDKYPQTKHIVLAVPPLVLFAGKGMSDLLENKRVALFIKYSLFLIILLYSLCYSFKSDLVFARGDTRYKSSEWILTNIPKGSKIETLNQINYICSDNLFDYYDFIYMGRSSKDFKGKFFFKWDKVENREAYLKYINQYDSRADFIIISVENMEELYASVTSVSHLPGLSQYLTDLFGGKKNFKLIKIFTSANRKISSKGIRGFYYPQSVFWNPVPSPDVVSPTIYVFKRVK